MAGESLRKTQPVTVAEASTTEELPVTSLRNHAVIVGCGRVGTLVAEAMMTQGQPFLVIEERGEVVERLRTGESKRSRAMRRSPESWKPPIFPERDGLSARSPTPSKTAISSSRRGRQTRISKSSPAHIPTRRSNIWRNSEPTSSSWASERSRVVLQSTSRADSKKRSPRRGSNLGCAADED